MSKKVTPRVVFDPTSDTTPEIIAEHIVKISRGMKELLNGPLTERAILLLLKDLTSMGAKDIKLVLDSVAELENAFVRKKKPNAV